MDLKKVVFAYFLFSFLAGGCGYAEDLPVAPTSSSTSVTGKWSDGWYQGASGYDQAVEEYRRTDKPMLVYVTVNWCPYCRKFEREILSSPWVQKALRDTIKVVINPESGIREDDIASQYRVRGFPSVFLHPPRNGRVVRLSTGVTPEMFVDFFNEASQ